MKTKPIINESTEVDSNFAYRTFLLQLQPYCQTKGKYDKQVKYTVTFRNPAEKLYTKLGFRNKYD